MSDKKLNLSSDKDGGGDDIEKNQSLSSVITVTDTFSLPPKSSSSSYFSCASSKSRDHSSSSTASIWRLLAFIALLCVIAASVYHVDQLERRVADLERRVDDLLPSPSSTSSSSPSITGSPETPMTTTTPTPTQKSTGRPSTTRQTTVGNDFELPVDDEDYYSEFGSGDDLDDYAAGDLWPTAPSTTTSDSLPVPDLSAWWNIPLLNRRKRSADDSAVMEPSRQRSWNGRRFPGTSAQPSTDDVTGDMPYYPSSGKRHRSPGGNHRRSIYICKH